jgi:hypothetical protein
MTVRRGRRGRKGRNRDAFSSVHLPCTINNPVLQNSPLVSSSSTPS